MRVLFAAMLATSTIAACGGGGSSSSNSPSFNYSKLDGSYTCTNLADKSKISFAAKFAAESMTTTFTSGSIGTVTVFKDIVGTGNGYPMYSAKRADGVNADTFAFSTDGVLAFGYGPISEIAAMKFQTLSISPCVKTAGASNFP